LSASRSYGEIAASNRVKAGEDDMRLNEGLRIKSAEYWLKLGQPLPALLELQRLPKRARRRPWAKQVFQDVVRNCTRGY
jgi:hypothetical protein